MSIPRIVAANAKAIMAGVGTILGYFAGVLTEIGPTATFGDLTTIQVLGGVTLALGVFGFTWRVPNRAPSE